MIHYQLDANVRNLKLTLEEMARTSERILKAGSAGDEGQVRLGVDQMRQLNSDLQGIDEKYKTYFDTRPQNEKAKITKILAQYEQSGEFCKAWAQRYKDIAPTHVLLELPDGPGGILDMHLPGTWDWKNDVIIFSDISDRRFIESVITRGQRRVLVYCANPVPEEVKITGAVYADDEKQIIAYFQLSRIPTRIFIFDKVVSPSKELESEEQEIHQKLIEIVHKGYRKASINGGTVRLFGSRWINQGVENLPVIARQPSYKHLAAKLRNIPLVVISPGPSLDRNIKQLHNLKDKAILVAPIQTAMALQKEKIVPDILIVADPSDLLYLVEDFNMNEVKALLIGVSCHPNLYKRYSDKIISFNVNGAIDRWISNIFDDIAPPGGCGSVSTMAFMLANELQCNPIILVGQDLSFSKDRLYSSGSIEGSMAVEFNNENNTFKYEGMPEKSVSLLKSLGISYQGGATTTLPGYYGGVVQTKYDYSIFHGEFESMAEKYLLNDNPPRLLNCTEGGAFIKGFEHIPLEQAIADIERGHTPPINKNNLLPGSLSFEEKVQRSTRLVKVLEEVKTALDMSIKLAKECHGIAVKIERGHAGIEELSNVELKLMREIKTSNYISIAMQDDIKNAVKLADAATTLKQNIGASKLLYKMILREAKSMRPLVVESLNNIMH